MATTVEPLEIPGVTRAMTYEEYLAGPVDRARYDILNGIKQYRLYGEKCMPAPTREHQEIQGNIYVALREFCQATRVGQSLLAPCDVLIHPLPLRTRQPDVLLIGAQRLAQNPPPDDPAPLDPAPELVVEIVSASETPGMRAAKLADYRSADVREVWLIFPETKTIELVALSDDAIETIATASDDASIESLAFPGLRLAPNIVFPATRS